MRAQTLTILAATLILGGTAQAQTSGVAHPEELNDSITTETPATVRISAPAGTPVTVTTPAPTAAENTPVAPALRERVPAPAPAVPDAVKGSELQDAGIVTTYRDSANSLGEGVLLHARLSEELSTAAARPGQHFRATLASDVLHRGQVVFPAGSQIEGRITAVHGGKRIGGKASLHLEPSTLTLPDGTQLHLSARVIDTDRFRESHVNAEGTIERVDHAKATIAALTLSTGSAAAAGAVWGGVPGALIGAGVGAGIGAAVWLRQDRQETLPQGSEIIFSLTREMSLTPLASVSQAAPLATPVALAPFAAASSASAQE